jgi:hypothetical protein
VNGPLYLLGPQRPTPNMPDALHTVERPGRVLYITAGWRHDENDDDALRHDVGMEGVPLPIYEWFEDLAKQSPDLFEAHHQQQDEIRALKALYRARLDPAIAALRLMVTQRAQDPDSAFVQEEFEDAVEALRALRRRFIHQCDRIREEFTDKWNPLGRPEVRGRVHEIEGMVREARAVLIAGGHVGVLRNRLEFFGLGDILRDARKRGVGVIAWSAGAMSLTDEIVLFHDDPPSGQAHPEVLDRGLGLAKKIVVLPHARQRLQLHDKGKVAALALRFPAACVGLENGAWLVEQHGQWVNRGQPDAALRLHADGEVRLLEKASV